MKNLLILTAIILSCFVLYSFNAKQTFSSYDHSALDSFPNTVKVNNDSARYIIKGMPIGGQGLQFTPYADTSLANLSPIKTYPGAAISVKGQLYIRDSTATRWERNNSQGGSTISIYQDSFLVICNLNTCDTINTHITVNNFTIINDSTIQVCTGSGSCDTININPTPFVKPAVDSVKVTYSPDSVAVDTIRYFITGNGFVAGYIIGRKDTIYVQQPLYVYTDTLGHKVIAIQQIDGIISPGYVTWTGTGLIFGITGATYVLNGNYYNSPFRLDTLSAADPTNPRIDLFIVDTTAHAGHITGTPAPSPTAPQPDPNSQLALTTGLTINPGDTIPNNATLTTIYDQHIASPTEWTFSTTGTITSNADNTDNPYHLTKAIFISSYNNGSKLNFLSASTDTVSNGEIVKGWVYFNGAFLNKFSFRFYNGTTAVSNALTFNNLFGLNPNDSNAYQLFAIPLSAFTWSSTLFNKLVITMVGSDNSGAKGYYLDYVQLQNGVIPVAPPTDYSNKPDSSTITTVNDSMYVLNDWIKGVKYPRLDTIKIHPTGGGSGNTNSNIGTGYRLAVPATNNIKTLNPLFGILMDSVSVANTISVKSDTAAAKATTSQTGYLSNLDWQAFHGKVDSVTKNTSKDSFYVWTNGSHVALKDSSGSNLTPAPASLLGTYDISTTTTTPPSTSQIRYNNATQTSATNLYVNVTTNNNTDITLFLGLLKTNDVIVIQDENDATNYQFFTINSTPVNNTTYFTLPVTFSSSGGTGTTNIPNNHNVFLATFSKSTASISSIFNIGSGFRWVKPTDTVKTFFANAPLQLDSSSNTNALTIKADTATSVTGLATQYDVSLKGRVDSIRLVNSGLLHTSPAAFALSGNTAVVTQTLVNQTANTVLAGPSSGSPAAPTFRALVAADLPNSTIKQTYTSGASVTANNTTTWLIINPASLQSALTITLAASPTDGQKIEISFGGTITSGNGVVTALTLSPNSGQTLIQSSTPSFIQAGDAISYRYNSSNTSWYRIN